MKNILKITVLLVFVLISSIAFSQKIEDQKMHYQGITDVGDPLQEITKKEITFDSITKDGMSMEVGISNIEPGSPLDIFIYDITGKKISEDHVYVSDVKLVHGIDTTKMSEGIYIITVVNKNRQSSKKIYNI